MRRWNHPGMLAVSPRGRPRTRPPPPFLAILRGNAQVPDLTVRCYVRPQRRRRRRLSGGATQTGRWGGRTALVCPSPARMAARQPSDSADLSLQAPKATVTLGQARTSPTVQIDAAEHRRGSYDHVRRWNHPGMLASAPEGRPRTHPPTTLGAFLRGHAQVPDLPVDCIIRSRRRRRRRLSGGGSQTGRSGSRTARVCPSPARMAARQPSDPADLSPTDAHGDGYTWVG